MYTWGVLVLPHGNRVESGQVSMVIITTAGFSSHFGRGMGSTRRSSQASAKVCWQQLTGQKFFILLKNGCMVLLFTDFWDFFSPRQGSFDLQGKQAAYYTTIMNRNHLCPFLVAICLVDIKSWAVKLDFKLFSFFFPPKSLMCLVHIAVSD